MSSVSLIDGHIDEPKKNGMYCTGKKRKQYNPTADVVKVKHGEWKEIKCGDGVFDYCFKCSNCGGTTPPKAFPVAPDYCPFCGSIMDGAPKESEVQGE